MMIQRYNRELQSIWDDQLTRQNIVLGTQKDSENCHKERKKTKFYHQECTQNSESLGKTKNEIKCHTTSCFRQPASSIYHFIIFYYVIGVKSLGQS